MSLPIKPLMGVGAGLGTGAAGFLFGRKTGENKASNVFNEYNAEENKQIEDDAFMRGLTVALFGMDKESSYSKEAFIDELEKISALKDLVPKVKDKLNGLFARGIKGYKNIQKNKHPHKETNELLTSMWKDEAKRNVRNIAIAGAGAATGAVAIHKAMKKEAGVASNIINKLDDTFIKGLRDKANMPKQISRSYKKQIMAHATRNKQNLAIAGAGIGAGAVASQVID